MKGTVLINEEWCKGCHICVFVCPKDVLKESNRLSKKGYQLVEVAKPADCIACMSCEEICPDLAITVLKEGEQLPVELERSIPSGKKGGKRVARGVLPSGYYFLQGDVACAEGAIAAGCRFYAGYPITPASEVMERMAERLPQVGGQFIQMEDEIGSISSVIGASWAGVKAMTATSGPGFSLMVEGIGYAVMTETPCVVVNIQRVGPSTGQATKPAAGDMMQAKWGSHGDNYVVALSPWSVQEMYDLTIEAFNLSEMLRVPALVMADEAVGHLRERIRIREEVEIYERDRSADVPPFNPEPPENIPPMPAFGDGAKLLVTGSTHDAWGFRKTADPLTQARLIRHLKEKVVSRTREIAKFEEYFAKDAEIVVVAYGFAARAALRAVKKMREEGRRIGLLRLITIWPFPGFVLQELQESAGRLRGYFVPEMNAGQIADEAKKYVDIPVYSYSKTTGEVIYPDEIVRELEGIMG